MEQRSSAPHATPASAQERRGFLMEIWAVVVGAFVGLVPLFAGVAVFLDPLRSRNRGSKFIRVGTLDSLPDDGVPRRFAVVAEHVDAWNRSLEPIGAVYLRRGKGQATPECLTATCPHAGCFVAFDHSTSTYKCPCHNSAFTVDGAIIEPSPSPRAMDSLDCQVEDQEILVKFENFYSGKTEKVAKE
jgi:menaquinol-cytochrome c reductase iron-sulfur subunit